MTEHTHIYTHAWLLPLVTKLSMELDGVAKASAIRINCALSLTFISNSWPGIVKEPSTNC